VTPRYHRHPSVRVTALEHEGVALHLDTHRYFTLNPAGLTLLEALAEPRTLDELGAALVAEYDVATAEAVDTARAFVAQCLERSMVVAIDA
jgi:hypothetical protein